MANRESYFSPSLSGFLIKRNTTADWINDTIGEIERLTPMEKQVLDLNAKQLSTREIANHFSVTCRTIATTLRRSLA